MVFVSNGLKARLTEDLTAAIKAKAEPARTVLRSLLSAVRNAEISHGGELDEAALTALLAKQLKQREESVAAYGSRPELAAGEAAEATVIKAYLPAPLSDAELEQLVSEAIAQQNASTPADIGRVMGALKPQISGRADSSRVAALVKAKLA